MQSDTITAIATPQGESALGIVRISGPRALEILKKIFHPSSPSATDISQILSHSVHHGYIKNTTNNNSHLDEVLVTVMRAPRSYTKEDIVEISGHGNPLILSRILDNLIKAGARLAEPGEFTKRAFLNGRIDLSQAEAVIDIINARTEKASESAINHLKGNFSSWIKQAQHTLREVVTLFEAEIDFSEDDIDRVDISLTKKRLENLLIQIDNLIKSYFQGKILKEGINTAIIGKVNVGKSSLFNILTENPKRALVTPIPGTTRDIIEECINLKGKLFRIIDTAGLKVPRGKIEKESLNITQDRIKKAACNIFLIDASKRLSLKDIEIGRIALKKPTVIAINKMDLHQKLSLEKVKQHFPDNTILKISCKKRIGIEELKDSLLTLSKQLYRTSIENSEIIITASRHRNLLKKAKSSIKDALTTLNKGLSFEFIVTDLRYALENLQEISGEHVTEDILNDIFSRFCIGK